MSFRSSLCRILRPRSLRSRSTGESSLTSNVANCASSTSGALYGGKYAKMWIDSRKAHIRSLCGNKAAIISGAFSGGKYAKMCIVRQSHIYSIYGNQAAMANGLLSTQQTRMSGYHPSYASGLQAMHGITFSNYVHSGKILGLKSKASLGFQMGGSRLYSGVPDSALWTLIGANVGVYTMWWNVNHKFMDRHFTVSIDNVLSGRFYTMLTSAFSHMDLGHLVTNLFGLYIFGAATARMFGESYFLALYLCGAIGGSLGHLFYFAYVYPWLKGIPNKFYDKRCTPGALGASGAVTSVVLLDIFLHPTHTLLLYFVIPLPAAFVGGLIIGLDLYLAKQGYSSVSVGCHLGGAVVAVLAYLIK